MYWKQSSGKWADTCSSSQQRPCVFTTKIKCKYPEDRPGCNCGATDLMGWNKADQGLTFVQQTYSCSYDLEGYMCWESTTNILSASQPITSTLIYLFMYLLDNKQRKTCFKLHLCALHLHGFHLSSLQLLSHPQFPLKLWPLLFKCYCCTD